MIRRFGPLALFVLGLILVSPAVPYLSFFCRLGIHVLTAQPGIGDVDRARDRIALGMTKDEVHSVLGRPHRQGDYPHGNDEWDYYETIFVGSVLRVHFGPDGRVTETESWCH